MGKKGKKQASKDKNELKSEDVEEKEKEEIEVEVEEEKEEVEAPGRKGTKKGKKGKKGKKVEESSDDDDGGDKENLKGGSRRRRRKGHSESEDELEAGKHQKPTAFGFHALALEDEDEDEEDDNLETDNDLGRSSKPLSMSAFDLLNENDEEDKVEDDKDVPEGSEAELSSKKTNDKNTKSSSSKKKVDDEFDAILAALENNVQEEIPKSKKKKKKAKENAEDAQGKSIVSNETPSNDTLEDATPISNEATENNGETKELSKAQLKRLKKKNKKTEDSAPSDLPAVKEKDQKSSKKPTAGIAALKAKLEKERIERERIEREEEERRQRYEEELRIKQEEEKRIEAEKLRKQEERAKKREELRKQGKLLTKSQKEKMRRDQEALEIMKAQGLISESVIKEGEASKKKKVVYDKKKKTGKVGSKTNTLSLSGETNVDKKTQDENTISESVDPSGTLNPQDDLDDINENEETPWDLDTDEEAEFRRRRERKREYLKTGKTEPSEGKATIRANNEGSQVDVDAERPSSDKSRSVSPSKKKLIAEASAEADNELRSPICCVLGHVDTGKTKILDKLRGTHVQDKEAGRITQQMGASYFPMSVIERMTDELNKLSKQKLEYHVPGLLVMDTPGHESFTNMRSRGSSLCDIGIVVVDIMHGLEQQTVESLNLLRQKRVPFIVALNKVDRIYDWVSNPWSPFKVSLKKQKKHCKEEFSTRVEKIIGEFQAQGLNCALYYENKDKKNVVSLVPTSALSGEGMPDLLMLLIQLTQKFMEKRLQILSDLSCTVLEVKQVSGLGTTIDVILSNGRLNRGDTIVLCGLHGPIVTSIRALLSPAPLSEMRVNSQFVQLQSVKAAAGIKISAPDLDDAISGSPLLVAGPDDDIEELKEKVMQDLDSVLSRVDKSGVGVHVQASSIGSLEALLTFLEEMKIPVSQIGLGTVFKKDIVKTGVLVEKNKEFAIVMAFDVPIQKDAQQLADSLGVKIFTADVIYHLFDKFVKYRKELDEAALAQAKTEAIFPSIIEIIPDYVFHVKDPIIVGVRVKAGILRVGTPLVAPEKQNLVIGSVASIEKAKQQVEEARAGEEVAIRIDPIGHSQPTYGRNFDHTNQLISRLTRASIDALKANFKNHLKNEDWKLVVKLKQHFEIV